VPTPTTEYAAARDCSKATGGHEGDARLRRFGFRIRARPRAGEPVWERGGRLYPQREAERLVLRELKKVETESTR
jgi:hypothetical protein